MTGNSFNINQQLTSVRLVSDVNLSGTYFNGSLNNGIGATLTALSNSLLTIDSVNVNLDDRILLSEQTDPTQNGIYDVLNTGSSSSLWILQRSSDFQSLEQLKLGQYFSVNAGSTFSGNMFVLVEPLPFSVGSGSINFVDVTTGGSGSGGQFLRIANNLSDVANKQDSFSNVGLGSGQSILLTDSDFIGGSYHLLNPCPNYITIACSTPGNSIYLPSAVDVDPDSFALSQGPFIIILPTFQNIDVNTYGGSFLTTLDSPSNTHFVSTSNASDDGSWAQFNYVSRLNGLDGNLELVAGANININAQLNGDIVISALSGPSAVSSGQANFYTLNTVTTTTFPSLNTATPIIVDSVNILYENNFIITSSSGTPNIQFLTTAARQCLINAVFTLRSSSSSTQTYSIYIAIKNGAMTTLTNAIGQTTLSPSPGGGPQEISLTYNLELTGPGDNVQFWIANNSTPTDPVVVYSGAVTILDTTQFGGFSSTDVLPQGINNLYLSQNGGSTYQNVNGTPVVVNNIASFNTTGGQLKDSGILSSSIVFSNPVIVTTSTQSMSLNTLYFNNYSAGQCIYSLPAATGSGKQINLISLNTASTSGWKVNSNGSDKIQFGSSLSASGGNIVSTTGSSTDCATFIDSSVGLWTVYPALGTNLIVT